MAGKAGTSAESVAFFSKLEEEPWRHGFFETLRAIESQYPDKPGFGRSLRPSEDPVRIDEEPSLKFAASTLAHYEPAQNDKPGRLSQYFFGLFGPNAPLPVHLTEYALQRKHNEGDATFAKFADIFHHRMASLLYRAWASSRPHVSFERAADDYFGSYVASLIGMNLDSLQGQDEGNDQSKLHYAGVLSNQVRSAESLEHAIQDFLHLKANVKEFFGAWMDIPDDCHLTLGTNPQNGRLGQDTVIGTSVWGVQQKFRIVLGPVSYEHMKRLLPDGESVRRFRSLVRYFVGDEKDWDVQIVVEGQDIPASRLGRTVQLGWTSWLGEKLPGSDPDDLIFSLQD